MRTLTKQQFATLNDFSDTYGIKREEILFFGKDPAPFFSYEATCRLCNELAEISVIDIQPVPSVFEDAISIKCSVTLPDGRQRSAVGVANTGEMVDGKHLSGAQLYQLASSRAVRNTLRAADIDLVALHLASKGNQPLKVNTRSQRDYLLAEAHKLGAESLLIQHKGKNKSAWYVQINNRYQKKSSGELSNDQLSDFIAFLKTLAPQHNAAA